MNNVYVISRSRTVNVPKLLKAWAEQPNFHVRFVVDPRENLYYEQAIEVAARNDIADVVSPLRDDLGLGYARKFAVEHANKIGLESFIMSDDDIRPKTGTNAALLCETATHPGAVAVGARVSYHDWALKPKDGSALRDLNRVILCPSGVAFRFFGVNVRAAMQYNFDPALTCQNEDSEFMRGWIARQRPWLLDVRVEASSIGARYTKGGVRSYLDDYNGLHAAGYVDNHPWVKECHQIVHERWPAFVNAPTEPKIRTQWAKMYNTYMPEWHDFSAIHGGAYDWDGTWADA